MIITKKNRRGDIILDSKCHIEQPIINWEKQCGIHYREKKVFEYRNANLLRDDEVIQFGMRCNTCQVRFKNFQNGKLQFSTNDVSEEMKNYMKDMVETQHGNKKCKVRQRTKREKKTKVLVPIPNHKIKVKYTICINTAFLSDVHVCILNFLYQLEAALSINVLHMYIKLNL